MTRLTPALFFALLGVLFAVLFFWLEVSDPAEGAATFGLVFILCYAAGGFVSGWLLARGFGREGLMGILLALVVGAIAVFIGDLIAGVLIALTESLLEGASLSQDVFAIAISAMLPILLVADAPWVAALWAGASLLLHLLMRGRAD